MNPELHSTERNPRESISNKKYTLSDFVEENSKLITSLAAFIALAAFSSQFAQDKDGTTLMLTALPVLAAVILAWELFEKAPPLPHQWRLSLFHSILLLLVVTLGWYWLSRFWVLWLPEVLMVVFVSIPLLLLYLLFAVPLTHWLTRPIASATARLLHRELRPNEKTRISRWLFLFATALFCLCFVWILHRLGRR